MQKLPTQLFTAGLACLFGTIVIFWVIVPGIVHWQVTKMIRLEEGNDVWKAWTEIDAEFLFKVYLFNVTNPEEVASGSNPQVTEIGPYIYEEKRINTPTKVNLENDTLQFRPTVYFHFRPDLSNGTEEDVITMLNVPLVAAAHELNTWSRMVRYMAKFYLQTFGETLFIQRTVKLALFEGVHVEMIESISSLLGVDYLPNNTYGYFYEKNGTLPYEFEIMSGVQDNSKFGKVVSWKGQRKLEIWGGDSCNMINGSDGSTLNPPFITKDSILRGFEADVCRSSHLIYQRDDEYSGIKGYRFGLPKNFFDSDNPDNECFCQEEDRSKCPASGALSMSACKWGAPLLMSHPYFMYADPIYNELTGLQKANEDIHESYAVVEPKTGVVLKGHKRSQISIQMRPSVDVPELFNVKETIIPLFWIDEVAEQSPRQINDIYWQLVLPMFAVEIGKWSMLAISSALTVIAVSIFMLRTKDKKPVQYY